jgi:hypothetical protein
MRRGPAAPFLLCAGRAAAAGEFKPSELVGLDDDEVLTVTPDRDVGVGGAGTGPHRGVFTPRVLAVRRGATDTTIGRHSRQASGRSFP